jgi:hypothetical protein
VIIEVVENVVNRKLTCDPDVPRGLRRNEVASKFPFESLPNLDTGRH